LKIKPAASITGFANFCYLWQDVAKEKFTPDL
jgi:hypothetical protein